MISGQGFGRPCVGAGLEVVAEAELHPPRRILHCGVGAQASAGKSGSQRSDRVAVETDTVGDVVDLPGELERAVLFELP